MSRRRSRSKKEFLQISRNWSLLESSWWMDGLSLTTTARRREPSTLPCPQTQWWHAYLREDIYRDIYTQDHHFGGWTFWFYKNGISKRNSSRPADIDLYKEAEQLDDERVLSDYNIQKEKESSVLSLEITWRNEDLHQDTHGERNHHRNRHLIRLHRERQG